MVLEKLEWDSTFFNIQIAKLELKSGLTSMQELENLNTEGVELLYIFDDRDTGDSTSLRVNNRNIEVISQKIAYKKTLKAVSGDKRKSIREIKEMSSEVYNLALESGSYSRFKLDTQFSSEHFEKLYEAWISNSISHKIASLVLGYYDGDNLLGMCTAQLNTTTAQIGLIAVDPLHQGKRIGGALLQYLELICQENEINEIIVDTQKANYQACSFYEKNGYKVQSSTKIFHFWV